MNDLLLNLLAVFVGSALGGGARYGVISIANRWLGERFPWGTLVVNVSGAILIGLLVSLTTDGAPLTELEQAKWLLIVGVCGSYTTVSSFSLQTLNLAVKQRLLTAATNVLVSVALCLGGVWLGLFIGNGWVGNS
ncbi:CrcB family protein [Alkalilimnicola ehrlichii]|uniref:fluoride efflux transporter FluC n=1 Tax=Alkalilimnicola ehrlichii TaxID=351052 RepID=UPI0015F29C48|nr:CrcB family protein [Alkalilimnicola ehrlichii]